ncbi:MAG TPA: aldehyde dehydrogenase family protein, partial [Gammaproteobacteria bacterium]|nr:aldehyde dehydrogenase family protein [Gammaproteobacteria bacterium]
RDLRLSGIVFTGSTNTAWHINQQLALRKGALIPFIAETGGQNAMIVDSTALAEQVVADVIASIFRSAGQRCSSLRVLYLQEEIFDKVTTMLKGAMLELKVGNPIQIDTDVGPVIDANAQKGLYQHLAWLDQHGQKICKLDLTEVCKEGYFVPPSVYEIQSMEQLKQENFGPILHVIKFARKNLDRVLHEIENSGFGLTLGIHSRIDETIAYITHKARVGNIYVNRNMIGAVVGVQPFGGERLSGTGPKAGGPNYIPRLATERTVSINTTAAGGNASLMALNDDTI